MEKKLYRDEQHKTIGGVCAGLAEYFGVDISVVRLLFVLALIFKGGGLLIYIILWIVLPKKLSATSLLLIIPCLPAHHFNHLRHTSQPRCLCPLKKAPLPHL